MDIDTFAEHPKSKDEYSVWRFYLTNKDQTKGRCIKCMRIIKAEGKSTSALHNHMKNIHNENTLKRHNISTSASSKVKITEFFQVAQTESLEEVIARMASLDGIPFHLFCTSEDIRKGLIARGLDIPRSPNSIRKLVLNYAEKIHQQDIVLFDELKSKGNKFSVTSDEWT